MRTPSLPRKRLVIRRTLSIGTGVGPPVTSTATPRRGEAETARQTSATSSASSGRLCLP